MFGDLKNFKQIMHDLGSIKDAVILLNSVFETMDAVMQRYIYIEKIKTIQSKILLVGGLDGVNCRIRRMVDMALTLRNIFAQPYQFETETESRTVNLNVAFGIEMGPIVAGIVGKKKFWYEVYGDVVNTGTESAKGGQIIVTEKVWSTVNDRFRGISLGERAVKGKGIVTIYSIQGLTPEAQREHDEAEEILSDIDMDAVYTVTGSKENLGEDRPRSRSGTKVGFSDSGTPVAVTSFTSRDRRKTLYGSLMESDINTQRRASDADTTIIKINNQTHEKKFERVDDEKENADKVRGAISDVIVKLCNGIDLSGDAEEVYSLYLSEIYDEVKPYTLVFRDRALERAFREDYCRGTSRQFMVSTIIGLLCEIVLMALSIFSSSQIHSGVIFTSLGQFYTVLILFILSLGIQMLLTGIVMFEGDEDETRSSRGLFRTRMILFGISAATMFVMTVTVSLVWDGMWDIPFYETCVIGSITTMYIMRIDGMIFLYKFSVVAAVAPFIIIINFAERGGSNWTENLAFIGATLIWITTFHMTEHSLRAEYLLDLMLETQTEMLEKEAVKSSVVLNTILPERVSLKMLADPDAIVFDNFPAITVLHMDVAGFTAMSSDLEPLKIVKMLNTLFTYFDRLTEDYNVEKIMTIGDAYVACSTLSTFSDPKEGAISVCVVALQMQSYVANHLNKSDFVVNVVKKPLSMRIGVHTGPGYGAIMGGSRNFRYDIMGDTVTFAERVQERCPLDKVNVSCTTLELVKDYHGFEADKSMTDEVDGVATCVIAATDTRMIASNLHSFELNKTPSGSPLTRLKTSQGKGKKDSLSKLFITSNK
ncbi:nucleotide cyclase [Polychytrium aggregatum]|uniref:nucleotide cyclase n=1 Tax=Polychytrium aggregatum TaxID=110093 RepID=UPI0022FEE8E7|nr:nucleotide cyclase [Polychytrium aggregatum]KAI9207326.1 nucleotide cyclase [Polychytrium aggregatum]